MLTLKYLMRCAVAMCCAAAVFSSVCATIAEKPAIIKASQEDITRLIDFWNGIRLIHGKIDQENSDGVRLKGTVWIQKGIGKKARLRLDYQKDAKQRLMVIKNEVVLIDLTDGSISAYPLSMTPADVMLKTNLKLDQDVYVVDANRAGNRIELILSTTKEAQDGTLTLYFDVESGVRLLAWQIIDPQGLVTHVTLDQESLRLNDPKTVQGEIFKKGVEETSG